MSDTPNTSSIVTSAAPARGDMMVGPGFARVGLDGAGLDDSKLVGCRRVDLGREDELITWAEWFQRSAESLDNFLAAQFAAAEPQQGEDTTDGNNADAQRDPPQGDEQSKAQNEPSNGAQHPGALAKVFRVTLTDGRAFAVTAVQTHIHRGLCFPGGHDRWTDDERPVCDVITGYTMIGSGPDGRPTSLSVPPNNIASVECVLVPQAMYAKALERQNEQEEQAFGFARFAQMRDRPELREVEDAANTDTNTQN